MSQSPRLVSDLRGLRYGEIFLIHLDDRPRIEVYNSFLLNDCPQELWDRLDTADIARSHGATLAVLNGPRYWMMDGIGMSNPVPPLVADFGGIAMRRAATVEVGGPLDQSPYVERHVNRGAIWYFNAGRRVYELIGSSGRTYVLQAYCVGVDPSLDQADLSSLDARLQLPEGWSFRTRLLDEELLVDTTTRVATVVQDELHNTYTLVS